MNRIEILTGEGFVNAVKALDLDSAICTYFSPKRPYCVWNLSEEDFEALSAINDQDWDDSWGWWRYSDGSNLGAVSVEKSIGGLKLKVWQNGDDSDISYPNLLEYLALEVGATTESNVTACCIDLARQNDMTLAELMTSYLK